MSSPLKGLDALGAQDSAMAKSEVLSAFPHRRVRGITIEELGQEAALFCIGTAPHGEQLRLPLRKHLGNFVASRIADNQRHDELDSIAGRQRVEVRAVPDESRKFIKRKIENPEKHPAPEPGQEFIPGQALLEDGRTRAAIGPTPSRWNGARPVCWYDVAKVKEAEEEHGALRLRSPRNERLGKPRGEAKIPRLARVLTECADCPAPLELPSRWLSWEGPTEPWATLSSDYSIEYPWVIDELVFATDTKTLHIRVGIDLPEVSKVAGHRGPFRFLPCAKCGHKRCQVCGQGIERAWYRGGLPVGGGLAVPTIVYGQAQTIRCPDCGVSEINLLQDLQIWANPNMPLGVRQMPTRPYVAKVIVRPAYSLRANKKQTSEWRQHLYR